MKLANPLVANARDELRLLSLGAEWLTVRAGGLNRYAAGLAHALRKQHVSQQWLVVGDSRQLPRGGVGVHGVASPGDSIWNRWRGMRTAFANALEGHPDLIASHFALYSYPVCRQLGSLPHVVHFHGPWALESAAEGAGWLNRHLKHLIERSVYRTGDRFITLSQAFADLLVERYRVNPNRVRVIPGGVDVERFASDVTRSQARELLGWDQNRPLLLSVRRLVRRTGVGELIQAMVAVRERRPEALLLIAGTGPQEQRLAELVNELGLRNHVHLLGFLPDEQLPLAYRAADFSVVPTQSLEGFGLIAAESLAAGTPPIVTPVGGLPEVVGGLSANLVTDDKSIEAIGERLGQALAGEIATPSPGECHQYAREHFSWSEISRRVLSVYGEVL